MTEFPIEVGYRSYIRLLRTKWDIVYHSKDLYFSHANKILEPHYDMTTKEFYGAETNPTRLAIVKFIDLFRDGPGLYEPDKFEDLLKHSKSYGKRTKVRKPYRAGNHQQSHASLSEAFRENWYQFQEVEPKVRELLPRTHSLKSSLIVESHPYEKLIGRTWTLILAPLPVEYEVVEETTKTGHTELLMEACMDSHDLIVVEPIWTRFFATIWIRAFWWSKLTVKGMYTLSIMDCCHNPHRWERNLFRFLVTASLHAGLVAMMQTNPLAKYKLPDRFHDTESLNELKYFKEFVPTIVDKVVVLFRDEEWKFAESLRIMKALAVINLFVLGYNHMYGIHHWFSFNKN